MKVVPCCCLLKEKKKKKTKTQIINDITKIQNDLDIFVFFFFKNVNLCQHWCYSEYKDVISLNINRANSVNHELSAWNLRLTETPNLFLVI